MAVSDKDFEMLRESSPTGGALGHASNMERKIALGALSQNMFSDDELLYTHPLDMTDGMLQAAQVRINESPEFAEKYRATTDYKPAENIGSMRELSLTGGIPAVFDKVTGRMMDRKRKGINF